MTGYNTSSSRPNVLVVLVDDMSPYQMGCYGSSFYQTPALDRLAAEGLRFTQAYSTSPVCSPARAGLYTGRHPARLHLTNFIPGSEAGNACLRTPSWRPFLPVKEMTLGDIFKAAGYQTAHFGKWHLARDYNYRPGRPMDPESQGFDEVMVTRKPSPDSDPEADPHHIRALTERAIKFVREPREQPFFCILAHNALHRPELAPTAEISRWAKREGAELVHQRPVLAAMVETVDCELGRLLDALRERGIERDTLVVFTSDHGAMGGTAERKPQRGAKADLYEGGIRVPLILRWPGRIESGATSAQPTCNVDVLPTLCSLAGVASPVVPLDGSDLSSNWQSKSSVADRTLYWHFPHYHHLGLGPCGAIRSGRYKLVEWFEGSIGQVESIPAFELFDLETDPGECRNLAPCEPAITEELAAQLKRWRQRTGAQEMEVNPDFDAALGFIPPPPPPGDGAKAFLP